MCEYNRITGMCCYLLTDRRTESTYPTDRSLQRSIASFAAAMLCLQSEHRGLVQGARPIVSSGDRSASLFLPSTNNLSHAALLLTKGEVYVTVGPTPRSKHKSFSNIGRVRRLREICPNFE